MEELSQFLFQEVFFRVPPVEASIPKPLMISGLFWFFV
jgi:hypothetical protein